MQQREIFETRASTYPNAFWSIWQICCFCFVCCMILSMYLCVACWGPRSVMCLLPLLFSTLFIEIASFTEPGVQGFRQTGWPASTRDPPIPARPALGFRRMPGFLRGLGLCACYASLLTELLRRLSVFFLYSFYSSQNWKISWSKPSPKLREKYN